MKNVRGRAKNRLTNAGKRASIALASVMIKIPYNGSYIECSSPSEAIEVLKHIDAEQQKKITHRSSNAIADLVLGTTSAWTRESFWQFIEKLGEPQKRVLILLVRNHKVADETLRKHLKLKGNQALAGVLSGISKQAGILNIPARVVYTVEDERRAGELHKTYVAANDFLRIANEMNWPEE